MAMWILYFYHDIYQYSFRVNNLSRLLGGVQAGGMADTLRRQRS